MWLCWLWYYSRRLSMPSCELNLLLQVKFGTFMPMSLHLFLALHVPKHCHFFTLSRVATLCPVLLSMRKKLAWETWKSFIDVTVAFVKLSCQPRINNVLDCLPRRNVH